MNPVPPPKIASSRHCHEKGSYIVSPLERVPWLSQDDKSLLCLLIHERRVQYLWSAQVWGQDHMESVCVLYCEKPPVHDSLFKQSHPCTVL